MAKTPTNVDNFLKQLISEYTPKADAETQAIEQYARKTEGNDSHSRSAKTFLPTIPT